MRGNAASVLQHPCEMHQVPCREGRIAPCEIIVEARAAAVVEHVAIGRPRARLANPACVGLWRDRVADMLERVEDAHRAVLDPVFVSGDEAAADLAVENILALVVGLARMRIEAFDDLRCDRAFLAQPDRRREDQYVGSGNLGPYSWPVVGAGAMFGHVGIDAGRDIVVDRTHGFHGHAVAFENRRRHLDQRVGMRVRR